MVILWVKTPLNTKGGAQAATSQHIRSWAIPNMWIGTIQQDNTIYVMDSPQLSADWIFDQEPFD